MATIREKIPREAIEAWEHAGSIGIQVEIDPQTGLFLIVDCMDISLQRNYIPAEGLRQALIEAISQAEQDWPFA
jgi:ABC-type transport system substrate-binding protein